MQTSGKKAKVDQRVQSRRNYSRVSGPAKTPYMAWVVQKEQTDRLIEVINDVVDRCRTPTDESGVNLELAVSLMIETTVPVAPPKQRMAPSEVQETAFFMYNATSKEASFPPKAQTLTEMNERVVATVRKMLGPGGSKHTVHPLPLPDRGPSLPE